MTWTTLIHFFYISELNDLYMKGDRLNGSYATAFVIGALSLADVDDAEILVNLDMMSNDLRFAEDDAFLDELIRRCGQVIRVLCHETNGSAMSLNSYINSVGRLVVLLKAHSCNKNHG